MKCPKCGIELTEEQNFCKGCGAKTEFADMPKGKIIIKRKKSFFGCAIPFSVYLDGKSKGAISNGKELILECTYGTHTVHFNSTKDKENRELTLSENKKEIKINIKAKFGLVTGKAKIIDVE
jgi:hypothetical protein